MSAHRYWRVYFNQAENHNDDYVGLQYIDFQDGQGHTLCVGGAPIVSSYQNQNGPAASFPGGSGYGWYSANQRFCWIGYAFAEAVDPAVINITPSPEACGSLMSVEFSDDGDTWSHGWYMTQSDAWDRTTPKLYAFPQPPAIGAASALHWMMLSEMNSQGSAASVIIAELRFLDAGGKVTAALNPRGAGAPYGAQVWDRAFDGNPDTSVTGGTSPNQGIPPKLQAYCQVDFAAPKAIYGMYAQSGYGGSDASFVTVAGTVYSSDDGYTWSPVWEYGAFNRTPGPPVGDGVISRWNTLAPPPSSPPRRCGPLIG